MSDQSIVQEALSLAKRLACETRRIDEAECRLAARLMVVRLEEIGLITREPGVPRSMRVAIPEDEIPTLN